MLGRFLMQSPEKFNIGVWRKDSTPVCDYAAGAEQIMGQNLPPELNQDRDSFSRPVAPSIAPVAIHRIGQVHFRRQHEQEGLIELTPRVTMQTFDPVQHSLYHICPFQEVVIASIL